MQDSNEQIVMEKKIKNFSENGDKEFGMIKTYEECLAWQLKYTSYFSKKICEELAELNWQRIQENKKKISEQK